MEGSAWLQANKRVHRRNRAREVIAVIPAVPIQDVGTAASVGNDRWENYWILLLAL